MNKLLILTSCLLLILLNQPTTAYGAAESGVAGISLTLDKTTMPDYMWTTARVNLRTEASTNSDIITTVEKRIKVETLKKTSSSEWVKVKYDNKVGYIHKNYLRDVELFTSKDNRWGIKLTDNEAELLAKILWTESKGESDEGNYAVIECILNRIVSLEYPDSLKEVLSQDKQFSSWGIRDKANPEEREYELIEEVLRGDTDVLSMDVVYFSTSPRNKNIEKKIGNHYFCKE